MMTQINYLALDQLTTLARGLSGMNETRQTRWLREAIAVLCNTRDDQIDVLSLEHKIYLLEEFGHRLQYTYQLLESLWDEKSEFRNWQQATGFFVALAKAASRFADGDSKRSSCRHEYLEEWCMDILYQQHIWMGFKDIEAVLGAFVQLRVYDADMFRILGNRTEQLSSELNSQLSVWNLLADADYMHVGLMEAVLTDLKISDVQQMSFDMQLSLLHFLAEAVNYYRGHGTSSEQLSYGGFGDRITACVEELSRMLQMPENVPAGECSVLYNLVNLIL